MAAITGHIPSLRRQIKNVACNYSDSQVKVREATSNDPWGASSSLMSEIADLTYNAMAFTEIMQMIWKRLNDHGKNWRHVYKSLVLLDYLIKVGSEKVAHQCRENIFAIQTLKDFQHIEDNKDQGMNVREKTKQLVAILKDDERLKNERTKALMARKRLTQSRSRLDTDPGHKRMETCRSCSQLEECRPTSTGEEELQLQIALALSKEEADKEQEAQKSDDMRLKLAMQESQKPDSKLVFGQTLNATLTGPGQSTSVKNTTALDDLLSLEPQISTDPWGQAPPHRQPGSGDPWSGIQVNQNGAIMGGQTAISSTSVLSEPEAVVDPWGSDVLSPVVIGDLQPNREQPSDFSSSAMLPPSSVELDQNASNNRKLKTPESFLGENSNLVNLDNLLSGGIRSNLVGMQPKSAFSASTNPFAGSGAPPPLANSANSNNPFAAQQKRSTPTLNEMRNVSASQLAWGGQPSNSVATTNPFL